MIYISAGNNFYMNDLNCTWNDEYIIHKSMCGTYGGKCRNFISLSSTNRIFLLLISMYNSIFYCVNHKSFSREIEKKKNNYLFYEIKSSLKFKSIFLFTFKLSVIGPRISRIKRKGENRVKGNKAPLRSLFDAGTTSSSSVCAPLFSLSIDWFISKLRCSRASSSPSEYGRLHVQHNIYSAGWSSDCWLPSRLFFSARLVYDDDVNDAHFLSFVWINQFDSLFFF